MSRSSSTVDMMSLYARAFGERNGARGHHTIPRKKLDLAKEHLENSRPLLLMSSLYTEQLGLEIRSRVHGVGWG